MTKIFPRRMIVFTASVFVFMLADMLMDWGANNHSLVATFVHILLAISIILTGHILMQRAIETHVRTEEILGKAKKELELKVDERTTELQRVNKFLIAEIAEREKAEVEREKLLDDNESAWVRALDLVDNLHLANNMLTTLIETLPAGMVIIDTQGEIVMENSQARAIMKSTASEDYYGFHEHNALNVKDAKVLPIEERPLLLAMRGITTSGLEVEYRLDDGSIYLLIGASPVRDKSGKITHAVEIMQDITPLKQLENSVRQSEEKFSTVFHHAPYPFSIIRLEDGVILEANQAFCKMLKQDRTVFLGKPWDQFGVKPNPTDLQKIYELMETTGHVTDHELQIEIPGLSPIVLLLSIIPISIGGKACVFLIGHNITERKQSEEALHQAQVELSRGLQERITLKERQRLARELHDSVSQALYGISLGAHTALTLFETDRVRSHDALNYVLELSQAGMTEMRALIFELRPESLKNEGVVAAISKQAAALRARHGIEVDLIPCEEPAVSLEIKEAIYRIALEAVQNALKHARCTHIQIDLRFEDTGLYLAVEDNGIGFDPNLEYPGHLGLHSMRERATNISASIKITSMLARGTAIHVHVPVCQADPAQA